MNSINRFRTVQVVHTVHGLEEDHQADCIAAGMAQHGLFLVASGTSCVVSALCGGTISLVKALVKLQQQL